MKPTIFFDLDDTVYLTKDYIDENIQRYIKSKSKMDEIDHIMLDHIGIPKQDFLTLRADLESSDPELAKIIDDRVWKHGLKEKTFINEVKIDRDLQQFIFNLYRAGRVNIGVCSHRQSIDTAGSMTAEVLMRDFPSMVMEIVLLNRHSNPDKLKTLGDYKGNFVLLDDNPVYGNEVLDTDSRLVIWDKHHVFPRYINQRRASDVNKLEQHISDLLFPKG